MKTKMNLTALSAALLLGLTACNPTTPQAQQDAREARAAADRAGDNLGAAARSTANAAGQGLEAAATATAEAAGEAAVVADKAADEAARKLDQATDPLQQAYEQGKAQQQQEEAIKDANTVP